MSLIHIDIETIPSGELPTTEWMLDNHPKTMSKADTIQKWAEDAENKEAIHRKKSLDYLQAQIIVVGAAKDDDDIVSFQGDDEKEVLTQFDKWLGNLDTNTPAYAHGICGYNIKKFDAPMLFARAVKYGLDRIQQLVQFRPFDERVYDVMEMAYPMLRNEYVSMDNLCAFLGLEGKGEIDGSMVYDYYKEGRLAEIAEYCRKDVEKTRTLYHKFR